MAISHYNFEPLAFFVISAISFKPEYVTALAAMLVYSHFTATLQALYSLYIAYAMSLD